MHKPGLEARFGPIEVDALKEDAMEMEVQIYGTAKALDKGHRPWVHLAPQGPARDCLVDVILTNRGADNRMDLCRQVL